MTTATLDIPLDSTLSEEAAREIYAQGSEAVVFGLMAMAKLLAEQQAASTATSHQTPSTPSGMKPVYQKPSPSGRGKKKPRRKKGYPGDRRPAPDHIDQRETHRAKTCPNCKGPLNRCVLLCPGQPHSTPAVPLRHHPESVSRDCLGDRK